VCVCVCVRVQVFTFARVRAFMHPSCKFGSSRFIFVVLSTSALSLNAISWSHNFHKFLNITVALAQISEVGRETTAVFYTVQIGYQALHLRKICILYESLFLMYEITP
jgi:hypothetical protein